MNSNSFLFKFCRQYGLSTVVTGNSNALTRKITCQSAHPDSTDSQEIHLFYVGKFQHSIFFNLLFISSLKACSIPSKKMLKPRSSSFCGRFIFPVPTAGEREGGFSQLPESHPQYLLPHWAGLVFVYFQTDFSIEADHSASIEKSV